MAINFVPDAGMWMRFDPIGCRKGCGISISSFVILCWCHISVNANLTDAAISNIPYNAGASENILSTSNNAEHKCKNMTSDISLGKIL